MWHYPCLYSSTIDKERVKRKKNGVRSNTELSAKQSQLCRVRTDSPLPNTANCYPTSAAEGFLKSMESLGVGDIEHTANDKSII